MGDWWPIQRLRLTTPRLELRIPSYDDLLALGDVAASGIHDPATMPFDYPWTDVSPAERARATIQWHWRASGALKPDDWSVNFVVVHDERVIGCHELTGHQFAVRREVLTGSWLGLDHHGRGIGTEMRAAVLHLAFAGLGATSAVSSAFADNPASNGVSRRLGYELNGTDIRERRGEAAVQNRYRLTRDRWAADATVAVDIHGLGNDVLELLGALDRPD
jgi:RimJ/RimL family protein N-acetyltransferase